MSKDSIEYRVTFDDGGSWRKFDNVEQLKEWMRAHPLAKVRVEARSVSSWENVTDFDPVDVAK